MTRRVDWSTKGQRHPRTAAMWEMRAEMDVQGGKGRCIFCEGRLPDGRRLHCGSPGPGGCEAAYQNMYHLGEMALRPEVQRRTGVCAWARCRRPFVMNRSGKHFYCSETCSRKAAWARRKAARNAGRSAGGR